ncbi:hypothetical protein [Lactococcus protaetiae]|uniref:hypothetical protein n=1 Tax=Lactococcus protaetiae TaxID=2592653 RepID=UPI0016802AE7|nr:hypothetical protein [Lactococcus protaetiae]
MDVIEQVMNTIEGYEDNDFNRSEQAESENKKPTAMGFDNLIIPQRRMKWLIN